MHLYGACGGLAGAILVGPRVGRFDVNGKRGKKCKEIYEPENVIAGTLILWWGWIGFNCGRALGTRGLGEEKKNPGTSKEERRTALTTGVRMLSTKRQVVWSSSSSSRGRPPRRRLGSDAPHKPWINEWALREKEAKRKQKAAISK